MKKVGSAQQVGFSPTPPTIFFNWNLHEETKDVHEPIFQNGKGNDLIVELRGKLDHGEVPCFFFSSFSYLDNVCKDPPQLRITFHGAKKDLDIVKLCSEVEQVGDDTPASRHGCPRNPSPRNSTLNALTDGEQEPSGEDHEGDDKLLPSDSRKARKGTAFVIALIM